MLRVAEHATDVIGPGQQQCLRICDSVAQTRKSPGVPAGAFCISGTLPERSVVRLLFLGDFLTGFLIDNLHRQTHLAAIVKAQKLHFHFLTFFQNI